MGLMIAQRQPDWEISFSDFCDRRALLPFEWGLNDCLHFTLDGIHALTTKRVWNSPGCSSASDAHEKLKAQGGLEALVESIAQRCKWMELVEPWLTASRGDLVLFKNADRLCVGLADVGVVLSPGAHGLASEKTKSVVRAWHIPYGKEGVV